MKGSLFPNDKKIKILKGTTRANAKKQQNRGLLRISFPLPTMTPMFQRQSLLAQDACPLGHSVSPLSEGHTEKPEAAQDT